MELYIKIIKKIAISIIFIIILAGENADISYATEKNDNITEQVNDTLVWSDEFDGETLDLTKWAPTEDIRLKDGCAVMSISYDKETDTWSKSWLSTQGRFGFKYGRLEARIKMTTYPGEYGAFWTMGYNKQSIDSNTDEDGYRWSKCGEIDIMEQYDCNGVTSNPGAALHWCDSRSNRNSSIGLGKIPNLDTKQWHLYAVEWDEYGMEIFYDGISIGYADYNTFDYYNGINPFHMPQYILFTLVQDNVAIADKSLKPEMWIDWVRVYVPAQTAILQETAICLKEAGIRKAIVNGRMAVGSMAYMDVEFMPSNITNQSYHIISSNEHVVSVNGGVLKAVSPGKAVVVAVSPTGKQSAMLIDVYYDMDKTQLASTQLENADNLLKQESCWYWGEYIKTADVFNRRVHTGLIKADANSTYTINASNDMFGTKINIIEYKADGSYIKWADFKDGVLKTGKDTAYIRINMTFSKSGITMSYGDYLEALKYSTFVIEKQK